MNRSVSGWNRTSAFEPKSLSQTWSRSSTYTAYGCGFGPGSVHSRHDLELGSYMASRPASHSLTQSRPRESDHMRRAPWSSVGGSRSVALSVSVSMRAIWLPASEA